jgi:hypothetical protein
MARLSPKNPEPAWTDSRIISTLSKELGWSHFVALLPLKKNLQRDFFAENRPSVASAWASI